MGQIHYLRGRSLEPNVVICEEKFMNLISEYNIVRLTLTYDVNFSFPENEIFIEKNYNTLEVLEMLYKTQIGDTVVCFIISIHRVKCYFLLSCK